MSFAVSQSQVETFSSDGVVLLRQAIPQEWIERLRRGVEANIATPSERSRVWDSDADGINMFYDSQAWRLIPEYRDFVLDSPMAELAGTVLGCDAVNFFFDAIFVRSIGAQFRTPFHQDEPFWSVDGFDCASSWMPLVPVEKRSALEFVRGSHRWTHRYAQQNFGALTGDIRDQVRFDESNTVPFPDIEGNRSDYDLVSWDMEPGDVAIFNGRTIHGGGGNLAPDRELRIFNTKWVGDDVRVCFRPTGMDPDHQQVMTEAGLAPGDRVKGDLYPEVWRRPDTSAKPLGV